jgi:hypothetical protein
MRSKSGGAICTDTTIWLYSEDVKGVYRLGMRRAPSNQASTVGGIVLVGLGVLFLLQQAVGFDIGHYGWPLFIILPGLGLLAGFAFGPRRSAGLAVPGCVLATLGIVLALQNAFNLWATWAYAWALLPAASGLGLFLQGERLGQPNVIRTGMYMFEFGLLGFVVFAAFFELLLDLNHFGGGPLRGMIVPAVFIVAGLYLMLRRPRSASGASS